MRRNLHVKATPVSLFCCNSMTKIHREEHNLKVNDSINWIIIIVKHSFSIVIERAAKMESKKPECTNASLMIFKDEEKQLSESLYRNLHVMQRFYEPTTEFQSVFEPVNSTKIVFVIR